MEIHNPVLVVHRSGESMVVHVFVGAMTLAGHQAMICNIARHLAKTWEISEDEMWNGIEREMREPSMPIVTAQ